MPERQRKFKDLVFEAITEVGVKEVARLFGVSLTTLYRWLSGANEPHKKMMEAAQRELEKLLHKDRDEKPTFGKLRAGDKFIARPNPEDDKNSKPFHLFMKVGESEFHNAVRLCDGKLLQMPESMLVVKIN